MSEKDGRIFPTSHLPTMFALSETKRSLQSEPKNLKGKQILHLPENSDSDNSSKAYEFPAMS